MGRMVATTLVGVAVLQSIGHARARREEHTAPRCGSRAVHEDLSILSVDVAACRSLLLASRSRSRRMADDDHSHMCPLSTPVFVNITPPHVANHKPEMSSTSSGGERATPSHAQHEPTPSACAAANDAPSCGLPSLSTCHDSELMVIPSKWMSSPVCASRGVVGGRRATHNQDNDGAVQQWLRQRVPDQREPVASCAFSATSNATQVSAIVGCVNEAREETEPALVLGLSESEVCFCRTNVSASTMGESDIERASPADIAAPRFHAPASSNSPPKLADLLSRGQELLDQQQEAEVHHSYANKSLAPHTRIIALAHSHSYR